LSFRRRLVGVLGIALVCTGWLSTGWLFVGCKGGKPDGNEQPRSAAPKPNELPPFELKDDTPNLLLTWVNEKGDFFVVRAPDKVPEQGRTAVRVVRTDVEAGTLDLVYVADLSKKRPDGTYPVKTQTRASWEELGAARRKARLEALAPPPSASAEVPTAPSGNPAAPTTPGAPGKNANASIVVIIYGASWCRPCHDAAAYLKQRGVTVIQKDIEENDGAAQEMRSKLARAGRSGASIPVIDFMGQLMVGFSRGALDRAIENAQKSKTL
jgi:glutaredoxin